MQLQPKVVEITLDSGVRALVSPLSRWQRNALSEAAEMNYPAPDKSEYEQDFPEGVAIEGLKIPAEDNPDYRVALLKVATKRSEYINTAAFNISLTYPDFSTRLELIEHFAAYLETQRDWMALPEDEWEATLRFAIIRSVSDENQIMAIIREDTPLTEAEITEEMRIFRPALSFNATRTLALARKHTPGTEDKVPANA